MRKYTIALIAHDAKKDEMVAFIKAHKTELNRFYINRYQEYRPTGT